MDKPGLKTSEFWIALLSLLATFLADYLPADAPREAMVVTVVYILSRTLIKLLGK